MLIEELSIEKETLGLKDIQYAIILGSESDKQLIEDTFIEYFEETVPR